MRHLSLGLCGALLPLSLVLAVACSSGGDGTDLLPDICPTAGLTACSEDGSQAGVCQPEADTGRLNWVWSPCAAGATCSDGACGSGGCEDECPADGERRCNGDVIEVCSQGEGGCLQFLEELDCGADGQTCTSAGETIECASSCGRAVQAGDLLINEVLADPGAVNDTNGDGDSDGTDDEFVELVNLTDDELDLTGVTLEESSGKVFELSGSGCLQGRQALLLIAKYEGDGTEFGGALVVSPGRGISLGNREETITLKAGETTLDTVTWGEEGGDDQSLTRRIDMDASSEFVKHSEAPLAFGVTMSPGRCQRLASFPDCAADCDDRCELEGAARCDGTIVETCSRAADGCLDWAVTEDCVDAGLGCVEEGETAACGDPCAGACEVGTTRCTDDDIVQNCEADDDGCGAWVDHVSCPVIDQVCREGACVDPCAVTCPEQGATRCVGTVVEMCEAHEAGCNVWNALVDCGETAKLCVTTDDGGGACAEPPAILAGDLVINEILADPGSVNDANQDGLPDSGDDEFIEILNVRDYAIVIGGLKLEEASGKSFVFPEGTVLEAGRAAVVFSVYEGGGVFGSALVFGRGSNWVLNNSDETVTLSDGDTVIDQVIYGSEGGDDQSITREVDGDIAAAFVKHSEAPLANGATMSPGLCQNGGDFPDCELVCQNLCGTMGATRCSGSVIERCERGEQGCLLWRAVQDCGQETPAMACDIEEGAAVCVDPCAAPCEADGDMRCSGSVVETCRSTGTCLAWVVTDDCGANDLRCDEEYGAPLCVPVCATECAEHGEVRCSEDRVVRCELAVDRCWRWEDLQDCGSQGLVCLAGECRTPCGDAPAVGDLIINELLVDPGSVNDANQDGVPDSGDDEFIEIVNISGRSLDLTDVVLEEGGGAQFPFPAGTCLEPDQAAVLLSQYEGGGNFGGALVVGAGRSLSLTNTSETVTLKNGETVLDSVTTGSEANDDQSMVRATDMDPTAAFVKHSEALGAGGATMSPGTCQSGSAFPDCELQCVDDCSLDDPDHCDAGDIFTCAQDPATGCLAWLLLEECGDGEVCITEGEGASCEPGCVDECDTLGESMCYDTLAAVCVMDGACKIWDAVYDCADDGLDCGLDWEGDWECTADCVDECSLTEQRCFGTEAQTCVLGDDLCTTWETGTDCALYDMTCVMEGGEPACQESGGDCDAVPTTGALIINEILGDPGSVNDANQDGTPDGTDDEFIEIVNTTGGPLSLTGVVLTEFGGNEFAFPDGTCIPAGGAAVMFAVYEGGGDFGGAVVVSNGGSLRLNNTGDTVTLKIGETVLDVHEYGSEGNDDQSVTRSPDGTAGAAFVKHSEAPGANGATMSPGTCADGSPFPCQ